MKKNKKSLDNVPEIAEVAKKITSHISNFEVKLSSKVEEIEIRLGKLEKDVKLFIDRS